MTSYQDADNTALLSGTATSGNTRLEQTLQLNPEKRFARAATAASLWLFDSLLDRRLAQLESPDLSLVSKWRATLRKDIEEHERYECIGSTDSKVKELWDKTRSDFTIQSSEFDNLVETDPRKAAKPTRDYCVQYDDTKWKYTGGISHSYQFDTYTAIMSELRSHLPGIIKDYRDSIPHSSLLTKFTNTVKGLIEK